MSQTIQKRYKKPSELERSGKQLEIKSYKNNAEKKLKVGIKSGGRN